LKALAYKKRLILSFPLALNPRPPPSPIPQAPIKQLIDGSLVEVFASSGEALTTRVYRGGSGGEGGSKKGGSERGGEAGGENHQAPKNDQNNHSYYLLAKGESGSVVTASRARGWGMRSCWEEEEKVVVKVE